MENKNLKKKIAVISEHYSKRCQIEKTKEELNELLDELNAGMKINEHIVLPE